MERTSSVQSLDDAAALLGTTADALVGGLDLVRASHLLGISPSTLRARALAGRIGYQRDGRRWLFSAWDLLDYMESRRIRANHPVHVRAPSAGDERPATAERATDAEDWRDRAREWGLV